jgi:dTDP-4-dehydrorhamnose reductase
VAIRILLLGYHGQLGWELQRCLALLGQVVAWDYPQVDLGKPDSLVPELRQLQPQVIVNAAAYTAVDQAETEVGLVQAVNAVAPGVLAEEARRLGAALIHYSSDYVFDGALDRAYREEDQPNPLNEYGRSKLAGDQAVLQAGGAFLVLRPSWVYSLRRDSFVTRVLAWARRQAVVRVVSDQVSSPTWCRMLAEATAFLLAKAGEDATGWLSERRGLYHLAGEGSASRYEWAQAILKYDPHPHEQAAVEIQPALTAEFPTQARRPLYTPLNCSRFAQVFGFCLPPWEHSLQLAMQSHTGS